MKFAELWAITSNRKKAIALAGSIAHELRTPMLGLRMEIDNFKNICEEAANADITDLDNEEYTAISARLSRHISKSSLIVDSLLQNVREESINDQAFNLYSMREIIIDVIEHFPLTDSERAAIQFDDTINFKFWGDELLMSHVVMNMIKNALQAISIADNGQIFISLIPAEQNPENAKYHSLIIRDTGTGMKRRELAKIFDRFYSGPKGGIGLGLAFCARVINSFKGTITCRSEHGQYTEFTIRLPRKEIR
ncbi:sensor histidine kinase [Kordiimonas sp. SCSIO 12610]|uniref:sensor histidine kinase n=1 Tax=Kordiimonas sp. SCSIO 12610 TaxID=2829597 RepID=UPI00210D759F|nr:HAMP domain-containing sensor histidine kinase [Kordiimonas sp. SCSIO 12610]UTW54462.1 HAMP domain-containing histidine kinase [Kordiimonas sp. SCSIO 12610]